LSVDVRQALQAAASEELARRRLGDFIASLEPSYERARHAQVLCEHLEAVECGDI
jgi:hypothetical protein